MTPLKTIAIIDDDEIYVYLTKRTIERANIADEIKAFGNGNEAINFFKENITHPEILPEIILLDLSMPIMDGWQFLEEFIPLNVRIGKKIIIYIVSSSISPEDMIRAAKIDAVTDFIIKPITKDQLVEIVKNI